MTLARDCFTKIFTAETKAASFLQTAFRTANKVVDTMVPSFVIRDLTTRRLIATGAAAYVVDIWDPIPIGETIAGLCALTATARGAVLQCKTPKKTAETTEITRESWPTHEFDYNI